MIRFFRQILIKRHNNSYLWNSFAGLINAAEAVILSIVITRTNGIEDAGILTIAFAVGNLMRTIGLYGMRGFQASDVCDKYSFSNYFYSRIITIALMAISSIAYILKQFYGNGYAREKAIVILMICTIYMIESLEDVFYGLFQKRNAIDLGGKLFSIRWITTLLVMCLVLVIKENIVFAAVTGVIVSSLVFVSLIFIIYPVYRNGDSIDGCDMRKCKQLLIEVFPLFAVSFLTFYVINAPKYAIDRWMTDEVQACYGFVAMPVFVIELVTSFFYQPVLVKMSKYWLEKKKDLFVSCVRKQVIIIICFTVLCLIGAAVVGIPVLSFVYGVKLDEYKEVLLVLLLGGGFLALSNYMITLLTIIRKQKSIFFVYAFLAICSFIGCDAVVRKFQVRGVSLFYTILMIVGALLFVSMFKFFFKSKSFEE